MNPSLKPVKLPFLCGIVISDLDLPQFPWPVLADCRRLAALPQTQEVTAALVSLRVVSGRTDVLQICALQIEPEDRRRPFIVILSCFPRS